MQQVEEQQVKPRSSSNSVDEHKSNHSRKKGSNDSKSSSEKVYLSPDLKAKADKLTFEICAEFVAMEIAGMFRKTINRQGSAHK